MSPVSVPEKTLEHWASQYITYRYNSLTSLWWPATGQDIDVRWLPHRPGKAVQLELKTCKASGANFQDVLVDLGQLWEYHQRPPGRQPFYVFPWPDWKGELAVAAAGAGLTVTEFGFSRSAPWWFASWMVVLTTGQVATILGAELTKHGCRDRGTKASLVRFDLRHPTDKASSRGVTWGSGVAAPKVETWLDFWSNLEACGRKGWPQLIRLPRHLLGRRGYRRHELLGLLEQAADWEGDGELVTLEPDAEGLYQSVGALGEPISFGDDENEAEDRRLLVFVDAAKMGRS